MNFHLDTHRGSFRKRRRSHASNFSTDTDTHLHTTTASSTTDPLDPSRTTHSDDDEFDRINHRPYPWIRILIRIFNRMKVISDKQIKTSQNFFQALLIMYRRSSSTQIHNITNQKQRVISSRAN